MKRYGHVQTEIKGDEKYLNLLVKKYRAEGYEVTHPIYASFLGNEVRENEYEIILSNDCKMLLQPTCYIDDQNIKHPMITQIVYKLK